MATAVRGLRADARRNQAQVLEAARRVILRRGPQAPLEEIAAVAGVGIATLYRRFVDREGLLRAVVLDALERSRAAAVQALQDNREGYAALDAYMRAAIQIRVAAIIPLVLDRLDLDHPQLRSAREASAEAVQAIVDRAHDDGTLAPEISFGDVGTLLVRLSRPLPGTLPAELETELTQRHLEIALAGLRALTTAHMHGTGPSRSDLRTPPTPASPPELPDGSGGALP